ncbi:dCTP deaminase domain-containing protein [Larsenimonas salina]|uniref:dCTP deaminase domain-containing protein n=1 Tax=Larsenimonas salina TaxID=1295565 RepID=UPI0020747CBD|nr:hypothetical protein [Larsenimonas salina]MCM5705331.1 hypothetical protein [Larsenimonas salina]
MFYGGEWVRRNGKEIFEPFYERNVDCSAYTMTLGAEAFISRSNDHSDQQEATMLDKDSTLVIPAGQFAYLLTRENVKIPEDVFALINIKNKFKVQGLVNVSGFHVDPGYNGKLIFAVFNAGSKDIFLRGEERIFLIWFSELKESSAQYAYGKDGIKKIESDLMNQIPQHSASLSSLDLRMRKIEKSTTDVKRSIKAIIIGIFISVVAGVALKLF